MKGGSLPMKVYVARQPIFDAKRNCVAYELLYRDGLQNSFNANLDGTIATKRLASDALTAFGLEKLTNGRRAFINFTRELLLTDFASYFHPDDVMIEILEDVKIDGRLVQIIKDLRKKGYKVALDDYIGDPQLDILLPNVDLIKVDFLLLDEDSKHKIAKRLKRFPVKLLAEKVETQEDFDFAISLGFDYFQGYFFAKPQIYVSKNSRVLHQNFLRIMRELRSPEPDFDKITDIIQMDVNLTYRLLKLINSARYYVNNEVTSIKLALTLLGVEEIQKWFSLIFLRDTGTDEPTELVKTSLVRAYFSEKIAADFRMGDRKDEVFLLGLFSMLDSIMHTPMKEALTDVPLSDDIKEALLGTQNVFYDILSLISAYELADWGDVERIVAKYHLSLDNISSKYIDSAQFADYVFAETSFQSIS